MPCPVSEAVTRPLIVPAKGVLGAPLVAVMDKHTTKAAKADRRTNFAHAGTVICFTPGNWRAFYTNWCGIDDCYANTRQNLACCRRAGRAGREFPGGPDVALHNSVSIRSRIGLLFLCIAATVNCNNNKTSASTLCPLGLALKPPALTSSGGSGTVVVSAQTGCSWQATTDASWITGLTPPSGQGNGEVQFQASANSSGASRSGNIFLNLVRLSVAEPGTCPVTISPPNQDVPAASSDGTVEVTAPVECGWTATSSVPWVTVTSGANGMGNGTVAFSVAMNATAPRSGTIAIGDQTFTINQADTNAPVCQFTIQPAFAPGGGTVQVTIQAGPACSWTAKANVSWLSFVDIDSGTGSGTVTILVEANPGNARTGTLTIAGLTFTVTQSGS
jgi:hypothetical protein